MNDTTGSSRTALRRRRAVLAVAAGGAIGGTARLLLTQLVTAHGGAGYSATLLVNLTGSLVLGMAIAVVQADTRFTPFWTLFAITGVIGGYTTFSAFAYDALLLALQGRLTTAVLYAVGSVGLGIAAVYLGSAAARAALTSRRRARR